MSTHLTASLEDYLEAIAELIALDGHAHTKEIAKKLNVKMPSVTGALRQLEKRGYIIYNSHYPVELTTEGIRVAREVVRRHTVLKEFFVEILGLSPEKATGAACHLEHAVDSDTIERFLLFTKAIKSRSDAGELQVFLTEAMNFMDSGKDVPLLISDLPCGVTATVVKVSRNLENQELAIGEGDKITVLTAALDKSVFKIQKDDMLLELSRRTAENIWAEL